MRLRPRPSRSSTSTTRSECSLWRKRRPKRSRRASSSASSPACPNGVCPRSWPSPIASTRSSFSRSARATPREIPVVSSVCVMPRAVVVAGGVDEDLRLVHQPPERLRCGRSGRGRAGTACAAGTAPPRARARASRTSARRAARASAPRARGRAPRRRPQSVRRARASAPMLARSTGQRTQPPAGAAPPPFNWVGFEPASLVVDAIEDCVTCL